MQADVPPAMRNRILFYSSKLVSEQMGVGGDYSQIKQSISIVVTGDSLIPDSSGYYHRFTYYDPDGGTEFSDLTEIHTIELCKLPAEPDGTARYDWASFINAETKEDIYMIAERNPEIKKARVKLVRMSADEQARYIIEQEEKARRDFRMHVNDAREKGMEKGMEKGKATVNRLNKYLRDHNLMEEFDKSLNDPAYQNELIAKYNIAAEQTPSTDTVNA
jgi:predicted transposase/invertase (TIGR01784 family)